MMEDTLLEHRKISNGALSLEIYTLSNGHCLKAMGQGTVGQPDSHGAMMYSTVITGTGFMSKEQGMAYLHHDDIGLIGSGTMTMGGVTYTHSTVAAEHMVGRAVGFTTSTLFSSGGSVSIIQLTNLESIESWTYNDLVKSLNCQ